MPDEYPLSIPFLTRDMLRFGKTTKLELRVDMQADAAAVLLVRGITREGQFTYKATTANTSLITQATFGVPDIPIYITVEDSARVLSQGSAFVSVSLLANGEVVQQLVSGYIYGQKALSWPNTQQVDLRTGGGKLTTVHPANPAAGDEWVATVPNGEIWLVHSLRFNFLTSAVAANRLAMVSIVPISNETIRIFPSGFQVANNEYDFTVAEFGYVPAETFDIFRNLPMPNNVIIGPGGTIGSATDTIDAGDAYQGIKISIEKFFTTPI